MGLFSILKRNSKLALRGSWGRAIIILLIITGVSSLISAFAQLATGIFAAPQAPVELPPEQYDVVTELVRSMQLSVPEWIILGSTSALSILLSAPLSLGMTRWYYSLSGGESLPVIEIFQYFETGKAYARALFYEINIGLRTLLWAVLFYAAPSAIFGISVFFLSGNEELSRAGLMTATLGIFLSFALFALATIFYAACVCRYTLTPYLMAEDAELTVKKAIKLSIKYTKGFRFSLVWFGFSYTGWLLLTVFFFPILYVAPYYSTGIAMYSRFIIEKNRSLVQEATQEFSSDTGELEG